MIFAGFFRPASGQCAKASLRHDNSPTSLLSHRRDVPETRAPGLRSHHQRDFGCLLCVMIALMPMLSLERQLPWFPAGKESVSLFCWRA
jgi:hypothetical protein